MINTEDKDIQTLVADIDGGRLVLPELQRRYVWDSTQVREFLDSLYHQYPSGQLLVWETEDLAYIRQPGVSGLKPTDRRPRLLLDGQQRLTSLAAVMLGRPLVVRWRYRPIDIVFNVYTEQFEVASAAHRTQLSWVSLKKLFTEGPGPILRDLKLEFGTPEGDLAFEHLQRLHNIRTYTYRVNVLEKLDYDEVTNIFVRINSGGTRLNSADLALAQISSRWRGVTDAFELYRVKVRKLGWELDDNILVRVLTAVLTNQSRLSQIFRGGRQSLTGEDLQAAWDRTWPAMDHALYFLTNNCLIDRLTMLPTYYVLVPLTVFFESLGKDVSVQQALELQRWLYLAMIWSRYTGATETNLDQDITALGREDPIQRMIQNIEDKVGRRPVTERELQDQLNNSPYMLMAYILARRNAAQDWFNGVAIGGNQPLEYHHIVPKARLHPRYNLRQDSRIVNQVANLAFLTQAANARIAAKSPVEYLAAIDESRLRAQYVPLDPSLWEPEHFEDFMLARRTALADAINQLLQSLTNQPTLWVGSEIPVMKARISTVEEQLRALITERLTSGLGPAAYREGLPGEVKQRIHERIEAHDRKNPSEQDQHTTLETRLAFADFSDYCRIMRLNWALFEDVFVEKNNTEQQLLAVQTVRNAFAHNREASRAELAHAEGGLIWIEDCLRHGAGLAEDALAEDTLADVESA